MIHYIITLLYTGHNVLQNVIHNEIFILLKKYLKVSLAQINENNYLKNTIIS